MIKEMNAMEELKDIMLNDDKFENNDFYPNVDVSDGSSYELTITYKDNRKRKFHGDVGGGTVDNTVIDFLKTIPELAEKI